MKLITARLFTATRKDGHVISVEQYLNIDGTFGYRMWNSEGREYIRKNFVDGTEAQRFYELQIGLMKEHTKKGNLKSWKEVK